MIAVWNRAEFTKECFRRLETSTDWSLIRKFTIFELGSTDGAQRIVADFVNRIKNVDVEVVRPPCMHIVEIQARHAVGAKAPFVAKIDNDTVVPPGWLEAGLSAFDRHSELFMLGLEAFTPYGKPDGNYSYDPAIYISGLGIWKKECFATSHPKPMYGRRGLEEWQLDIVPQMARGWIKPAIGVYLLDKMPMEPWVSLSKKYERLGWQRPWGKYLPECQLWDWVNPVPEQPMGKGIGASDPNCQLCHGTGRAPMFHNGSSGYTPCNCKGIGHAS